MNGVLPTLVHSAFHSGMFSHPFIRHAFLAGLPVSALSGAVGYLMVLRGQVFTGDALSHVAFTGALAALAFGVDARLGLFALTLAVGLVLGLLGLAGADGRTDDVVIGTVFAWILGLGVLALSIYTSSAHATANGAAGVNVLFGSIFGLSEGGARTAGLIAVGLLLMLLVIARPLIFAGLDQAVAAARGVPTGLLGVAFLLLVGASAAEATQAVGALLLLGLLAAPAGAAHRLTRSPFAGLALASALSIAAMTSGLLASYLFPKVPPSFAILAVATVMYATGLCLTALPPRGAGRGEPGRRADEPARLGRVSHQK